MANFDGLEGVCWIKMRPMSEGSRTKTRKRNTSDGSAEQGPKVKMSSECWRKRKEAL